MNTQHQVELNFVYLHKKDAEKFVLLAEEEKSKLQSFYARHAILSSVFAIEALVNKILNDFYILPNGYKSYERLGIREKLFKLPLVCGKDKPIGKTFDQSKKPFQSFSELVDIRNWMVHPKNGRFVEAHKNPETITIIDTGEEVTWIETDNGSAWSITKIPLNPFELNGEHARIAYNILKGIISELFLLFDGIISEKWMDEIIICDKEGNQKEIITIDSLWGGYTPNKTDYLND